MDKNNNKMKRRDKDADKILSAIRRHYRNCVSETVMMAEDFEKMASLLMGDGNEIAFTPVRITDAANTRVIMAAKAVRKGGDILIGERGGERTFGCMDIGHKGLRDVAEALYAHTEGEEVHYVTFRDRTKVTFKHAPRRFVVRCDDRQTAGKIADDMSSMEGFNYVRITKYKPMRPGAVEINGRKWSQELRDKVLNEYVLV